MPFKVAPGSLTAVTPPIPTVVKAWPCTAAEADPPTLAGSAAYTTGIYGMPCIDLGATAGSSVTWGRAPLRGPNMENFTRVRGWVLARDTTAYPWSFGFDTTANGKLRFGMGIPNTITAREFHLGTGSNVVGPSSIPWFGPQNHWFNFSMVLDRAGRTFTVTLDGGLATLSRNDLSAGEADGTTFTALSLSGTQGAVSGLLVDYYN